MNLPLIVLTALAWAVGGGLLAWLVTLPLHRRSLPGLIASVALTGSVASVAAVIGNVHAMFISMNEVTAVVSVSVVAGLAAGVSAAVAGRRLAKDNRALNDAVRAIATGQVPDTKRPRPSTQLAQVHRELAETAQRLADSRERERALEQSRRELVAWISHDLRTPLAGLRAMSEALEDGVVDEPATYYKQIHGQVDRLTGMVDDLFDLSRIQAGAFAAGREPLPLDDLVSDCLAALDPLARAGEVELRGDSAGRTSVAGNGVELNRALTNLVANAIEHTPPGGRVHVDVHGDGTGVDVVVSDGCGGIPVEAIDRVFDVAYRVEHARTAEAPQGFEAAGRTGGAGLGLAIARGIVEAHAGRLTVRNVAGGCAFRMHLPTHDARVERPVDQY